MQGVINEPMCAYPNQKYHLLKYNYFKTSRYSITTQVVVDSKKKLVDVYIGFLGFVNDSHVLQKNSLHSQT
jgi:hypothetical protein